MSDNIAVDTITGAPSVATDQIGAHHFQLVKVVLGALDANDGPVASGNPLPVTGNVTSVGNVATIGTSVTPGVAATNLGKAIDSAVGATDTGVAVLAKRVTTPATITPANGDYAPLQLDDQGSLRVNITAGGSQAQIDDSAFTPGSSEIVVLGAVADEASTDSVDEGDMGAVRMTLDRKLHTVSNVHTSGGWTPYRKIAAGTSGDATNVKASAGQLGWLHVSNVNAEERYLKFYNSASAPTAGSGTPVLTFLIPGATTGNGFTINFGAGIEFSSGIGFTLVTGVADSNSTSVTADETVVNLGYK